MSRATSLIRIVTILLVLAFFVTPALAQETPNPDTVEVLTNVNVALMLFAGVLLFFLS